MQIPEKLWIQYRDALSRVNGTAAREMDRAISLLGGFSGHEEEAVRAAFALVTKYGEAAGELACEFYDAVAAASGKTVEAAIPAETATFEETAKAVYGTAKISEQQISSTVGRLVKQVGADTTLKNAQRDHAQFAWIPAGDTCAFCLTLASRGWQYISAKSMKNGHAPHIHQNCDCEYCVRFDNYNTVEGYDPDRYYEMYENAEGDTPQEKINSMRREIDARKRALETAGEKKIRLPKAGGSGKIKPSEAVFAGEKPFEWHWDKHKDEFPDWTQEQYLTRARELLSMPLEPGVLEEVTRSDGSISRYYFSGNEFVATTEDRNIRTFFRPIHGKEYWDVEHERNK